MKLLLTIRTIIVLALIIAINSCSDNDDETGLLKVNDVKLTVNFGNSTKSSLKSDLPMTKQTPDNYYIALKSATMVGKDGTTDFKLFTESKLSDSFVFDFTNKNIKKSLLKGSNIPEGKYSSMKLEIYYLQMKLPISTKERGVEKRNIRIYLSDDAETENGVHQPGDMTQIDDNGQERGWLLGEGQTPNMDPVTPRTAAYTNEGAGQVWYDFAGKNGKDYGPFGDVNFMNEAPHPIFNVILPITFSESSGANLIVEFNVKDCWNFQDKNGDGNFGAADLDPVDPTHWHMSLPTMKIFSE